MKLNILLLIAAALISFVGFAQQSKDSTSSAQGWRDFDFEIGNWKTKVKLLADPLSGSTKWLEFEGTSVVSAILGGKANLVELSVTGPNGSKIEGLSLRLYNPDTQQWSLNFVNIRNGILTPPSVGSFKDDRGVFYGQETLNGKVIFVRFVISDITPTSCHFEQAFSEDGGKTWETNWIATDTLIK
jgi:hypothetical protein